MRNKQLFVDCEAGDLPTYTFIEPQVIGWGHNDMHPPFPELFEAVAKDMGVDPGAITVDPPSSLVGGDELLLRIYNAVRSSTANGSNHLNTTVLVTFDEHGGTYGVDVPLLDVPKMKGSEAIAASAEILAELFPLLAES